MARRSHMRRRPRQSQVRAPRRSERHIRHARHPAEPDQLAHGRLSRRSDRHHRPRRKRSALQCVGARCGTRLQSGHYRGLRDLGRHIQHPRRGARLHDRARAMFHPFVWRHGVRITATDHRHVRASANGGIGLLSSFACGGRRRPPPAKAAMPQAGGPQSSILADLGRWFVNTRPSPLAQPRA